MDDLKLNFNTANINNLFAVISQSGFNGNDFTEDFEQWGGGDKLSEEELKSLRIYWNENPNYKFVWHQARRQTQTYFFPNGIKNYGYQNKFPMVNEGTWKRVFSIVCTEFNNWLEQLKAKINDDNIANERRKGSENSISKIPPHEKNIFEIINQPISSRETTKGMID